MCRFSNGEVRYDDSCSKRCECYSSQWICQATDCEPGFRQKGLLRTDTDPLCQERAHPGGDECCVCGADNKTLGDDGAVAVGDAVAAGHMTNLKTLYLTSQ